MYDKVKSESKVDVPKLMGNVEPNVFMYFIFALLAKLQETLKNCQNVPRSFLEKILVYFSRTASDTTSSTEREFPQNGQYLNDS